MALRSLAAKVPVSLRRRGSAGMRVYRISLPRRELNRGFELILYAGPVIYTSHDNQFVVTSQTLGALDEAGIRYALVDTHRRKREARSRWRSTSGTRSSYR